MRLGTCVIRTTAAACTSIPKSVPWLLAQLTLQEHRKHQHSELWLPQPRWITPSSHTCVHLHSTGGNTAHKQQETKFQECEFGLLKKTQKTSCLVSSAQALSRTEPGCKPSLPMEGEFVGKYFTLVRCCQSLIHQNLNPTLTGQPHISPIDALPAPTQAVEVHSTRLLLSCNKQNKHTH